jgi:hypothetical protein
VSYRRKEEGPLPPVVDRVWFIEQATIKVVWLRGGKEKGKEKEKEKEKEKGKGKREKEKGKRLMPR